jgi:hypothetical protein
VWRQWWCHSASLLHVYVIIVIAIRIERDNWWRKNLWASVGMMLERFESKPPFRVGVLNMAMYPRLRSGHRGCPLLRRGNPRSVVPGC